MNHVRNVPGTQLTLITDLYTHACLLIFDCMPGIVSFTLLGDRYFCVPLNIIEFCYVMQLSYLDIFGELLILI